MKASNLAELYDTPLMEWDRVTDRLNAGYTQAPGTGGPDRHSCWLTTINSDGSPHVTGVGALWVDGTFWFETGRQTRKGRNVARDPRCSISLAVNEFDLVVDGRARLVTDPGTVAKMAGHWAEGGWPCEVDDSGTALTAPFMAPSGGPPPWHVYRIDAVSATALQTVDPGGATRWDF
jgi:hypothetical protein